MDTSPWRLSWRADPVVRAIADRHYNRQKPGADQFVPPGRCLVLKTADGSAAWTTSWPFPQYDGLTQDRGKRDQGDADYDAGWYRGYIAGCDRVAEASGTCVPEGNREYWDHADDRDLL